MTNPLTPGQLSELKVAAQRAAANAYCDYSRFPVGAAVRTTNGRVFAGCNVENASLGLTNCAERTAIFSAVTEGFRRGELQAIILYMPGEKLYSPCGACRQVIAEFFHDDAEIIATSDAISDRRWSIKELLPAGFNF